MTQERISNELLYEVLKSIQEQVATIREDTDNIKLRLGTVESRIGDVIKETSSFNNRMDRIDFQIRSIQRQRQAEDALIPDA